MTTGLRVRDLAVSFGPVGVLDSVDFAVGDGECVALVGGPGSGKSTLLGAIAGLVPATGSIEWQGREVAGLDVRARIDAGIATVPEGRRTFSGITVADTLRAAAGRRDRRRRWTVRTVFELFPFLWSLRRRPATELGPGEQQALAIGRALVTGPDLLLVDEPSYGLAPAVADRIGEALTRALASGIAAIVVDHDQRRALEPGRRVLALADHRIVFDGAPDAFEAQRDRGPAR